MNSKDVTDRWRVANYQIPVPIGDCSAHFLIDKENDTVVNAFLMDGGTNAGGYHAWAQILKGLRHIDLTLGPDWRFDSWVVTHWDEDHYRGVRDLLSSNARMTRCIKGGPTIATGRTKPLPFAQQYFTDEPWLLCGALDHVMAKTVKNVDVYFLDPFVRKPATGFATKLDKAITNNSTRGNQEPQNETGLRCIAGKPLVGVDLFSRTRQFNLDGKLSIAQSVEDKNWGIEANPKEERPRFSVVGANGYGIGSTDRYNEEPSRNETSILAILFWPGSGGGRCSYFTGGDGNPLVEKHIVEGWMRNDNPFMPHGDVELIKLDHHGSTKENLGESPEKTAQEAGDTTTESSGRGKKKIDGTDLTAQDITETVFQKMKPKGLLVTPGNRHGHPTWDVLLVLDNYLTKQEGALGLFTTRSFYWLDTNEPPGIKKLNFNHNSVLFMQELYKLVCKTYNEDDDDDPDVVLNDLIVLDQQERVKLQAEFERHKKAYGRRLQEDGNKDIVKKGKIVWKTVQAMIDDECGKVLGLGEKNIDTAFGKYSTIKSPTSIPQKLFWSWCRWSEAVYVAQREGAEQCKKICWQPIINDGNPHYLIRFHFDGNGKKSEINVYNDTGEYEHVQHNGTVTSQTTNLVVVDKNHAWADFIYTPLGVATIYAVEDITAKVKNKPNDMLSHAFKGNKDILKWAVETGVLFDASQDDTTTKDKIQEEKPSAPAKVTAKEKKQTQALAKKQQKIEGFLNDSQLDVSMYEKQDGGILEPGWDILTRSAGKTEGDPTLSWRERGVFVARSRAKIFKLSETDLTAVLKHDEVCFFVSRYMPGVERINRAMTAVRGQDLELGELRNWMRRDRLLRRVNFILGEYREKEAGSQDAVDGFAGVVLSTQEAEWLEDPQQWDYVNFLADYFRYHDDGKGDGDCMLVRVVLGDS